MKRPQAPPPRKKTVPKPIARPKGPAVTTKPIGAKSHASRAPPPPPPARGGRGVEPPPFKRPAHRPTYVPTEKERQLVTVMVAGGIDQVSIAAVLGPEGGRGISLPTLRKHFRREIDTGAAKANATVTASLYQMATTGKNVVAAKWWTQARMGWAERVIVADGGMAEDAVTLSDAEIEARLVKLRRKGAVMRAGVGKPVGPLH